MRIVVQLQYWKVMVFFAQNDLILIFVTLDSRYIGWVNSSDFRLVSYSLDKTTFKKGVI